MIVIVSETHAAAVLRHLRLERGLSRLQVADRLFVSQKTIGNRERGTLGLKTQATVDTARTLGYELVLVPARRSGARPTGTGWPA